MQISQKTLELLKDKSDKLIEIILSQAAMIEQLRQRIVCLEEQLKIPNAGPAPFRVTQNKRKENPKQPGGKKGHQASYLPNTDGLMMPKKKPKARELSEQEKRDNRLISGIRMVVQQAIGGIKRLGVIKDIYHNRKGQDDKFILLSAALWNYHLCL